MPALVAGIHVFLVPQDVNGRDIRAFTPPSTGYARPDVGARSIVILEALG
jgi:hypothetical protein